MDIKIFNYDQKLIEDYISGKSHEGYKFFGPIKKKDGYIFRIYAPNADRVYIKGDFNNWENEQLSKNPKYGYFFKFIKANIGDYYKYVIEKDGKQKEKMDPFARSMDKSPDFASRIVDEKYSFEDNLWMQNRDKSFDKPLNIYELHIGSWKKFASEPNFLDIVDSLIKYLKDMNYTHVEILPITEHPYYPSWGYQTTGFYSVTSRYGQVKDLKKFVDLLHQNNIGVILDFVLVHFASDYYGLRDFDFSNLYESKYDGLKYSQWGSLNFDYSKGHVRSFMKSAIFYFLETCHFDGIRMDAISYMLYYDGNQNNGENHHNIEFLKDLNSNIEEKFPSVMKIAEDSSSYNNLTKKIEDGGIGFDYKWDMGWMNDSIKYFEIDSINRTYYQGKINFSMFYFYNENYILPLSHDEVVHLKKPMIDKMNGSYEQKFKQLKLFYIYQMTHPGKKLNFMGNEIATFDEWNENSSINFDILKYKSHQDYNNFIRDLNYLYVNNDAFYKYDYDKKGFKWLVVDDNKNSVFSYMRISDKKKFLVLLNMTNVYHKNYRINIDEEIVLLERLNSLDRKYGDYKDANRKIKIKEKEALELELYEYEAVIFEVIDNEK